MFVVDDALLLAILAGSTSASVARFVAAASQGEVFTTGSWYWRLSRALAHPGTGALSRALAALADNERRRTLDALEELPEEIGLLSLRRLIPVMAVVPGNVNLLTAEAVAAATVLGATIAVTTQSGMLDRAAVAAGVTVEMVNVAG